MCEILLRVVDKINVDDFYANCQCLKRGDIVVAVADGHEWSAAEQTAPYWRIVKFPGVPLAVAESFLSPEPETDPQNPSRTLQRRSHKLDLDGAGIPAGFRAWLADNSRVSPAWTANFTGAQLLALKRKRDPVSDPNILD